MTQFIDQAKGDGLLIEYLDESVHKVLLVFNHGMGDVAMFRAPLAALRGRFPKIRFDVGLSTGLDQESLMSDAILLQGNWKAMAEKAGYDLVYYVHFPMEDTHDLTLTKSEICCAQELGIEPVAGHLPVRPKPLIACHFQITSVPVLASADERVARQVWDDIRGAGCVPIETHFEHIYHNPVNKKFDFVDLHVRACRPNLDSLISLIGACYAFVGVVSGPFHLAMSILPYTHVLLLEKKLRAGHFTKLPIATASLDSYKGEVREWLKQITS